MPKELTVINPNVGKLFWLSAYSALRVIKTIGGGGSSDVFQMARRHTWFPQLYDAANSVGTWAWGGYSGNIFGGTIYNTSNAIGDELWSPGEYVLQPGTWELRRLAALGDNRCVFSVYLGDTLLLSGLSDNDPSYVYNQVFTDSFVVATKISGKLRIVITDHGATGSSKRTWAAQQIELVKTSADSDLGESLDDLPWVVDAPPIAHSALTGPGTLTQNTSNQWGSEYRIAFSGGDYAEYKVWLAQGVYDFTAVLLLHQFHGAVSVTIDGVPVVGTFDGYAASSTYNDVQTIPGINVPTTGVHTVRLTCDGGQTGHRRFSLNWLQFRKTSETGAIPATGTTYGRETMELWPWFADSNTGFDTFALSGNSLYYGYLQTDGNQFDSAHFKTNLLSGIHDVDLVAHLGSNRGIVHLSQDDGSDIDSVDTRNGGTSWNQLRSMSGALSSGTIDLSMDSTSGSDHYLVASQIRLVRTGA